MSVYLNRPYVVSEKSGTSQLHEALFERIQNDKNALDFLDDEVLTLLKEKYVLGDVSFFFDMDGTLTCGIPGVHETEVDHELSSMLHAMRSHTKDGVAIITGRPNYYMENLLPESEIPTMTEFGAVYQFAWDEHVQYRVADRKLAKEVAVVKDALSDTFKGIEGVRVEDHKKLSVTVEFTSAANAEALEGDIEAACNEYLERQSEAFREHFYVRNTSVPHNRVIDILPKGKDKGEALNNLLCQDEFASKTPVFFGDSSGDEPGMVAAQENDGYALGVGEGAPELCDYVFKDMVEVQAFLLDLIHAREVALNAKQPLFLSPKV